MPDLKDGESTEMKGSGAKPYVLKNVGGVYSCTCPAWRNQSVPIERRTCKHLRKLRGDEAEEARIGGELPEGAVKTAEGEEGVLPVLLALKWEDTDPTGWWMSEKLDGVRAYWDGKQFQSRNRKLFLAPDWFVEGLPEVPLDGELWIDRKKFNRTSGIVRRADKPDLWNEIRYVVFDAPAATGGFEERLDFLADLFARRPPQYARTHEHQRCRDLEHLLAELARVEALGGEGLMLREPGSRYETNRSPTLLKVKTFHDAEGVIIGHQPGEGRHKGRLGALWIRLPSGIEFRVGTGFSDRERDHPPAVGATITFRYQEFTNAGVPRFPIYAGVRQDAPAPAAPVQPPELAPAPASSVPVSVAPPAAASAPMQATGPRYFEFVEGKSSKFWEVSQTGCALTTRWGRIGSAGQSKTKTFADEAATAAQVARLIAAKTAEGYVERPNQQDGLK
jgi:DNA ligase-1